MLYALVYRGNVISQVAFMFVCSITHTAVVWPLPCMHTAMPYNLGVSSKLLAANVTFMLPYPPVHSVTVCSQAMFMCKCTAAHPALVWPLHFMHSAHMMSQALFI